MANRLFNPVPFKALDSDIVVLFGTATFGSTSSVSSTNTNGMVISALGTGTFDIQLGTSAAPDKYGALLGWSITPLCASAGDTGWQIIEQTVSTDGTLSIRNAPGGVATHPVSGTTVSVVLFLRNSTTPRKGT